MKEKIPSLALLVAKDTDKVDIAWVPGSDGVTPANKVNYNIYFSTSKNFTPGPATLKKTVTGTSQAEVTGLAADTLYYGKVVALYSASSSAPSNSLQTKTYKAKVQVDSSTTVAQAADLGLGKHSTSDGATYTYNGGTPPATDDVLFSEDAAGGMTLRRVDSASTSGATVTVQTSDASLTDVLDRGSVYSSFQLFDVASQAKGLPLGSKKIATAKKLIRKDGSRYSRMDWKNKLLSAEQTNYAYNSKELVVIPKGKASIIKLVDPKAVNSAFTATVTASFEPELITTAEWGGVIFKYLDSAQVAAKGTLSLTALARYDFAAAGSVSKNFQLFKRTWTSLYTAGPVPVYQDIILTMDVAASASAQTKLKAMATASLSETVEVGARYDGSAWTPYIIHNESDSLAASLDIVGQANAEIRLIPKIEVKFYKVASASLTVEPFATSSLTFQETTNNGDFLLANPEHLIQLTSFDSSLGMEANVAAALSCLGWNWDALPSTCVLGTTGCSYSFSPVDLFSIPQLNLTSTGSSATQTDLQFQVTDGTHNSFKSSSARWEVFPDDATITLGSCSRSGIITTCTATFEPGTATEYTVFASGYGKLNEMGRQFKEIQLAGGGAPSGAVLYNGLMWQQADDGNGYNWYEAAGVYDATYNSSSIDVCGNLVLGGYSDWRLPTQAELRGLVVCSNGNGPIVNYPNHPYSCYDGNGGAFSSPTIDAQFSCHSYVYWSSSVYDAGTAWAVSFYDGGADWFNRSGSGNAYVRCVR